MIRYALWGAALFYVFFALALFVSDDPDRSLRARLGASLGWPWLMWREWRAERQRHRIV